MTSLLEQLFLESNMKKEAKLKGFTTVEDVELTLHLTPSRSDQVELGQKNVSNTVNNVKIKVLCQESDNGLNANQPDP
jgi:hypothetical protein